MLLNKSPRYIDPCLGHSTPDQLSSAQSVSSGSEAFVEGIDCGRRWWWNILVLLSVADTGID